MIPEQLKFSKKRLNIILAYTKNKRFMGYKNDLPWKRLLQADMNYIKLLTTMQGKVAILMGKNTFKSIPKPFTNRLNIVLSRSELFENDNVITFSELDDAIKYCKDNGYYCVIFGGSKIYGETFKYPHRLYSTIIEDKDFEGDTVMPCCDTPVNNISDIVDGFLTANDIKKTWVCENNEFTENGIKFTFNIGDKF
ncbi:Dihydrofolate reductase [Astathelohania contejeani]|uniref:Dihydrofolate reductase n=1 Tax=Astathelohania contejeani TaxID=164912 RepID=A0ABQ7HVD8_9MICR|nr:Dihydrofolate reductase [Thelohania contejeani]